MKFTFGIITAGNNLNTLQLIFDSIYSQIPIDSFEIILVGGEAIEYPNLLHIPFDENQKRMWITKKKNLITNNATHNNVVYMHDYISLVPGWYKGQLESGNNFDIRMDKIINYDGTRFRDWCLWPHNDNNMDTIVGKECLIPYNVNELNEYMYISGAYWICKKNIMVEYPLNEDLSWGEGEDVEWSKQVRLKYKFQMNVNSSVKIIKPGKDKVFEHIKYNTLQNAINYANLIKRNETK
jgi:hypothetical protein